jgi:hypothetical protein
LLICWLCRGSSKAGVTCFVFFFFFFYNNGHLLMTSMDGSLPPPPPPPLFFRFSFCPTSCVLLASYLILKAREREGE